MKKFTLDKLIISLFLVIALGLFAWFNINKPRILILHSYDPEYAWTRDVNIGIGRVMKQNYQYQTRWYYMDTKRHPFPAYKQSAGIAARSVIDEMQPDVIIAIDDDAQKFAAQYYRNHPHINIVFAGVNNEAADYGYDKARNVTGILERLPVEAMKQTLQIAGNFKALGRPIRIGYLADTSESATGDRKQIEHYNWQPLQLSKVTQVNTWADWQTAVHALDQSVDVILVSGYRKLSRPHTVGGKTTLVPAQEVVSWTEKHAHVPVISANGFFTEEGGMLAIGTSPYEQGEVAAHMALDIALKHKAPHDMPFATSQQFIVTMSESKMKAHQFDLPKVYEAAARTGDKFFE